MKKVYVICVKRSTTYYDRGACPFQEPFRGDQSKQPKRNRLVLLRHLHYEVG
jgi:hypothetical protein